MIVLNVVKDRFGITNHNIKYFYTNVDEWVDLERDSRSTQRPSSRTRSVSPSRPNTPKSRPVTPVSRSTSPESRPATPVSRPITPTYGISASCSQRSR